MRKRKLESLDNSSAWVRYNAFRLLAGWRAKGPLLEVRRREAQKLIRVLQHEAEKVCHPKTSVETKILFDSVLNAFAMLHTKKIEPEEAVEYIISRFKREKKNRASENPRDLNSLYQQEEFLVSEIASLIGKTPRTVQRHVKTGDLKQKHPHARILRRDLLEFLSKHYSNFAKDFEKADKQRASAIEPRYFMRRAK
ncbi:helix-turn-helix domain-containing protein [bacterium]|nr:helix-turn-helix domain-containing protein [bacterium]